MKRLIPMFVLLIITLSVCFLGSYTANKECDKTKKELSVIKEKMNDLNYTEAKKLSKELEDKWNDRRELLSIFVNHGLLDDVTNGIHRIKGCTEKDKSQNFLSEYQSTHNALDLIIHEQKLTAESFY